MTRTLSGLGWLVVGVFIAAGVSSTAQPKIQSSGPDKVDPGMPFFLICAKECDDCARSCELSAGHCVQMLADGKQEVLATLRACQDCAVICSATSRIVAKDGPFVDLVCPSCAEACKRCAALCEKSGDPIIKKCAEDCRKCEKACRDMPKPRRVPENPKDSTRPK